MDVLNRPAEEFGNDDQVESMWAMKAFEHYDVYFNLICSVDARELKLTPFDDFIYDSFRQDFPDMDVKQVNEDEMKSAAGKERWRQFIYKFDKLDDYNFLTICRKDVNEPATEDNSFLCVRIQFLAIEIARNREGLNDRWRNYKRHGEEMAVVDLEQ